MFPRRDISEQQIQDAHARDAALKQVRKEKINASKYRQRSTIKVGDRVLIRNYNKPSKYLFQFSPLVITAVQNDGRCLTLQRLSDGQIYRRHPDDVKLYNNPTTHTPPMQQQTNHDEHYTRLLQEQLWDPYNSEGDSEGVMFTTPPPPGLPPPPGFPPLPLQDGRPVRHRIPNPR